MKSRLFLSMLTTTLCLGVLGVALADIEMEEEVAVTWPCAECRVLGNLSPLRPLRCQSGCENVPPPKGELHAISPFGLIFKSKKKTAMPFRRCTIDRNTKNSDCKEWEAVQICATVSYHSFDNCFGAAQNPMLYDEDFGRDCETLARDVPCVCDVDDPDHPVPPPEEKVVPAFGFF